MPFSVCGPRSSTTNISATNRCVAAVITTVSGSAAPCTRAATFAVSPKTSPPSAITTGPGVQADAHRQARPGAGGERGVEWPHGVHDREACPDRPFRVVLARGGPAEVDEQAIAEFPVDVAAEAPDGPRGGLLVLRDEVAPLLGVELLRERRRAHEVAEEDGELTALAGRYRGVG